MQLFDATTINQFVWPETEEARQIKAFWLPMMQEGVTAYIDNVETALYLLSVDQLLLPVTVNSREYHNSYLISNYFPLQYLNERFSKKGHAPWLRKLYAAAIHMGGAFLKGMKINKVVMVNNWLLTTNLYPQDVEKYIPALTHFLHTRFPDHLLIFRSLNAQRCGGLLSALRAQRYRMVGSRYVYMYDPAQKATFSGKISYNHRKDRSLIAEEGYEVVRGEQITAEELTRALALYRYVYVDRHTKYSPQYTEKFVQEAVRHRVLDLIGVRKEGKLQGIFGCHERYGTLVIPFLGYAVEEGIPNHLYRILVILGIDEAERRGVILDNGSGADAPKKYRGMRPTAEYVAFYDNHLPLLRRLFWGMAERVMHGRTFSPTH